jgi:MFS family permease
MAVVMITIFMNLLLFPYQQMVPVIGKNLLALAPWQIGVLQGATGMGALIGGIAIASSNSLTHHGKVYLYGSLLALTVVLLFSFSKWFVVSLPLLVILGAGAAGFGTMQSAIVVLSAREEMRGRALGVITVAIGANPLGALLIGVTATMTSPSTAITINAVLGLLIVGAIGFAMPSLRQPITADESAPQSETALASTKSVT